MVPADIVSGGGTGGENVGGEGKGGDTQYTKSIGSGRLSYRSGVFVNDGTSISDGNGGNSSFSSPSGSSRDVSNSILCSSLDIEFNVSVNMRFTCNYILYRYVHMTE